MARILCWAGVTYRFLDIGLWPDEWTVVEATFELVPNRRSNLRDSIAGIGLPNDELRILGLVTGLQK